ncbi:hypothetical protein VTN00DRAFT_3007 [Thermoascus crustaceus]|uniref:uncharacterized protein n=1 Tax=Thermoascus crustaceus TaxID=5088 RepID=UPI003743D2FC
MEGHKASIDDVSHVGRRYKPRSAGILSYLPEFAVPYAELMRLSKPGGYCAFFFPHMFGALYASTIVSPSPSPRRLLYVASMLACGSVFLRSAACTWNDYVDRDYDRQVARCRNRPLARGAVSTVAAIIFMVAQTATGAGAFLLPLPPECRAPAAVLTASQVIYPFCKRFTHYPQVVLGFSLALGHFIGAAAMGLDAFALSKMYATSGIIEMGKIVGAICSLYLAGVINRLIYDTVYGHQDLEDDLKANVNNLAVAWQGATKRNCSALAVVEVALLAVAGFLSKFGSNYYISAVGGTAAVLAAMLRSVDLERPESCMEWFNCTIFLTGGTLCVGLGMSCIGL